jgi:RecJ-like exonuclease
VSALACGRVLSDFRHRVDHFAKFVNLERLRQHFVHVECGVGVPVLIGQMCGQDHNLAAKILDAQTLDQLDPGRAWHFVVDNDNVESSGLFGDLGKRLVGIKRERKLSRWRTEREGQGMRHAKLVVHRKNVQGRRHEVRFTEHGACPGGFLVIP